jgi:hypothetical protein
MKIYLNSLNLDSIEDIIDLIIEKHFNNGMDSQYKTYQDAISDKELRAKIKEDIWSTIIDISVSSSLFNY